MIQFEYFEMEISVGGPIREAAAKGWQYRADGRHVEYSGQCGSMMASLGSEGWEMAGSTSRVWGMMGNHINYIFKRPVQE